MPFFDYSQNNSFGTFDIDVRAGISTHVIVEARDADEADRRAESIGLYFDGSGDCPCCGDRWCRAYGDGDAEPTLYGEPVAKYDPGKWRWTADNVPTVFVHFLDGRIAGFGAKVGTLADPDVIDAEFEDS